MGRPSSLHHLNGLTGRAGGAQTYLKREDSNHTGSHNINNVLAQTLLARTVRRRKNNDSTYELCTQCCGNLFSFCSDSGINLIGLEAAWNVQTPRIFYDPADGSISYLHGAMTYVLQDEHSQTSNSYSIFAGLEYPAEFTLALRRANTASERKAAMIAFPASTDDDVTAVTYATRSNLEIAVKCSGHHYSNANSIENGTVIDMGALRDVSIDKENSRVTIGGRCLWGDVYMALRDENLVCVGGGVHVVGVGGHLTGGTARRIFS
ncbi:uncharacterized protein Z518_08965 [Rhinocladiella mackenziei CBS 650.93]|uniref:FAD-binding PCMH-type domain-containing protein n=1 Tax=Rhinocladiella mackenziei CBS 650.93 TaxID=1442369 RepID=A0A0D2IXA9_9EURO|nr:uncharacterized protein Z518_08965 [Rhinocladiella mackenziei CBS 650.93]KIX01240.1 hypothetical protein Z518_08965 [Rhinocladiella mackenziei CBS 650.93]